MEYVRRERDGTLGVSRSDAVKALSYSVSYFASVSQVWFYLLTSDGPLSYKFSLRQSEAFDRSGVVYVLMNLFMPLSSSVKKYSLDAPLRQPLLSYLSSSTKLLL
ncbi:uncharacterized protein LOC110230554 [Arabidopsis lyrata subsp. lyrata]|uniref:uncharacterized protein LOC110230554 n=1 Tax=Arabidopsis lyrata subsp. lyrata TaxID=81972 RepID=UPI000A29D5ED|nr:uncharacterized protein LOC110230554 [Arabidopsis lyrata subsp. lyrata]|eukprot:XP_020889555.1 uncharacterized protein LOC110230554 [Arabidopsis lyrata subsp. lyrata]